MRGADPNRGRKPTVQSRVRRMGFQFLSLILSACSECLSIALAGSNVLNVTDSIRVVRPDGARPLPVPARGEREARIAEVRAHGTLLQ